MTRGMRAAALAALALLAACAHEQVTLLPGEGGKSAGALAAINEDGSDRVVLSEANSRAALHSGSGALRGGAVAPAQVETRYGRLIGDLPPPPRSYVVGFDFGQATLKPEEEALLQQILDEARIRPGAEVQVIGHADTYDADAANDIVSKERAEAVRDYLIARGLPKDIVRTSWRGEREPLIDTGDNVKDERNRRVQVVVR